MVPGENNNSIKLVVGLGNPGEEYRSSRHNAGFMVVDRLLAGFPAGRFEIEHIEQSNVFTGRYRGRGLTLQQPLTYMNLSGLAVAGLCGRLRIVPEEVLVVVDDLDLEVGRLRLRAGGSSGGHNGLKSIASELGSENFKRLRVGIGRPTGDTADYVLSAFDGKAADAFAAALDRAADAVRMVLSAGLNRAMNKFNPAPEPERENITDNDQK